MKEKNIGYRFSLLKPKFCLISSDALTKSVNTEMLKKHGIEISKAKDIPDNSPFQFIVRKAQAKVTSNQRVLFSDNSPIDFSNLSEKKIDLFKKNLWACWTNEAFADFHDIQIMHKQNEINIQSDFNKTALFDSHGREIEIHSRKFEFATLNDLKGIFRYYDPYTTRSGTLSLLNQKQLFYGELIESIGTSVCIIDERIQEAAEKHDPNQKKLKISELLSLAGILIPPKDETYDLKKLLPDVDKCKQTIEKYILEQFLHSKYIVIHFTIFEKLAGSTTPGDIKKYLDNFTQTNQLHERGKVLVFMSGRGTPSNLPKDCYYIHLSTIQNAVLVKRSKFSLVKILYSIRKSR